MGTAETSLRRLAARQYGLVARSQARAAGLTDRQIDGRTAAGRLVAVHRGVYRMAGAPRSREQVLLAACLAAGPGVVAPHRSAAALWELRGVEWPAPELTVPRRVRPTVAGATVHRSTMLGRPDVTRRRQIPVTTPARTLLDLGAVAPELVEPAMEDALFQGLVTVSSLRRALDRAGAHGRGGTAVLRDLVDQRARGATPTESPLEDALVALLRRHRLPEPVRQHPVELANGRTARVDLAYPAARLGIEATGGAGTRGGATSRPTGSAGTSWRHEAGRSCGSDWTTSAAGAIKRSTPSVGFSSTVEPVDDPVLLVRPVGASLVGGQGEARCGPSHATPPRP